MSILSWVLYIFIAIVALLLMITIHEFGHYTAGKILKFKINEFSIGFGKAIYSKTKANGEKFSLRIFPLGGYCAFEGEDEDKKVEGSFNSHAPWKRLIVLFCGAFFNFLSAIIFSFIFLMCFGYADKVEIKSVELPTSVVDQQSWLMEGDQIVAVNGQNTDFVYDRYFSTMVSDFAPEETFNVTVIRNGQEIVLNNICKSYFEFDSISGTTYNKIYSFDGSNYCYAITYSSSAYHIVKLDGDENIVSTYSFEEGKSTITIDGYDVKLDDSNVTDPNINIDSATINISRIGVMTQYHKYGFFEALGGTFVFCFKWVWKILISLWQLISGQIALTSLGGTVTTVVTMAEATSRNFANLLLLIPLISINLAVFNLLPIPALDGARMVFVGIEWVRGKPINRKIEGNIHFIGLMVLLAFVVFVDILHFLV